MFDVGGRLVLQDNFSQALDAVVSGSDRAEQALRELGNQGDASGKQAKARIAELTREIDQLKAKAKSGGGLTVVDVGRFREASGELKALTGDIEAMQGATRGASSAMELFGKVSLATGAAFGAMRIAGTVMELTKLGAQAQTMAQIFGNLSESVGINSDKLLGDLRRVSRGTVDDVTLMTTANRALLAGGADLAGKVPQLFEIARAASLATGQDISFVFETLIRGINKASPLLIDNADIYIKVGAAVDDWAAKQGKVADELSLTERRMAIANAVIDQGAAFMDKMGVSAATAADRVQSMAGATGNLKIALGELLAESGVVAMIEVLAKNMQGAAGEMRMGKQIETLRDRLQEIGADNTLSQLDNDLRQLAKRRGEPMLFASSEEIRAWKEEGTKATQQVIDAYNRYADVLEILRNPLQALREGKIGIASASQEEIRRTEEAQQAWDAYRASLAQTSTVSLTSLATQLGQLSTAMKNLANDVPQMPQIGATLFSANVGALREYINEITRINPNLAEASEATLLLAADLEFQQNSMLQAVVASDSSRQSLLNLAEAALGTGSSILDLAKNFDKLPESAQRAINPVKLLEQAIADLRRQTNAPITLDVAVQGLQSTLDSIDSMALRLSGVLSPDKVRAFRDKARADAETHWQAMGKIDEFGMQLEQKVLLKGYEDIVTGTLDSYKQIETGARQAATNVAGSASELAGKVKTALSQGLDVTDLDFTLTNAGQYEDKALEAARQLAAIAARGFAELDAHPDWAGLLKIPPDVLAGSETELKAWAARTQADVQDLARPDLINWDAFIENFRAGLDREAAQELTIDIAVDKLNAAGLLSGSDEDRRKQVAEALGISEPSITIDTLFQVGEEPAVARQNLLDQFLGEAAALEVPATLVWQYEEGDAEALGPKQPAALAGLDATTVAKGIDMDTVQTELETQGQKGIFHIVQGAMTQLEDTAIATKIAGSWLSDFSENWEAFANIGTFAGDTTFTAFYTAMEKNIGNVRKRMAEIILPEVVAALGGSRGGALP